MNLAYARDNLEQQPYMFYLEQFFYASPQEISSRTKIPYYESIHAFRIRFLERLYEVSYPNFSIRHLEERDGPYTLEQDIYAKILLLRYLLEGDPEAASGHMISYQDLPWGDIYGPQFKTMCLNRLARQYGTRMETFRRAMESIYAVPVAHGDIAYQFELFSGLHLCFILWNGDEEDGLEPSAQVLFSDNCPLAFTAEDAAQAVSIVLNYMDNYDRRSRSTK